MYWSCTLIKSLGAFPFPFMLYISPSKSRTWRKLNVLSRLLMSISNPQFRAGAAHLNSHLKKKKKKKKHPQIYLILKKKKQPQNCSSRHFQTYTWSYTPLFHSDIKCYITNTWELAGTHLSHQKNKNKNMMR
jgi:hypothetical protein